MKWEIDRVSKLSGRIYNCNRQITEVEFNSIKSVRFLNKIYATSWELYNYKSLFPLCNEEIKLPFYEYPLVVVKGSTKIILLSQTVNIVDVFQKEFLKSNFDLIVEKAYIRIHDIVSFLKANRDEIYIPTTLHGTYLPKGDSLRNVSFYGEDILDSKIFTENIDYFNFYKAGFKVNNETSQFLLLGNTGTLSLNLVCRSNFNQSHEKNIEISINITNDFIKFLIRNLFFNL